MKVSERLYSKVKDIWESYNLHPFVQGIANGNLPIDKFQFYMIQDHLYLLQYAKVFALGLIKAEKESLMRTFSALIHETLDTENATHQAYLKQLGITREMIDSAKMSLINESYTNYMISIGFKEGLAEIAVAVLACSWSYKLIGEYVASVPNSKDNEFYRPWIDTYASEEYIKENDMTIDLVNSLTENYTEEQLENLEKIIVNCSRYEYMFWDMAWNKEM